MPQGEAGAGDVALVAGVGGGGNIAAPEPLRERAISDVASPTAVAHSFVLAVPTGGWQPDFDLDIGVAGRFQGGCNAAELGEILEGGVVALRELEPAGGDDLGGRDSGVREGEGGEPFTSGRDAGSSRQTE